MACNKNHSKIQDIMESLPADQGGIGRHKCAACAYDQGYKDGQMRKEKIDLEAILNSLEESQAQGQRHIKALMPDMQKAIMTVLSTAINRLQLR